MGERFNPISYECDILQNANVYSFVNVSTRHLMKASRSLIDVRCFKSTPVSGGALSVMRIRERVVVISLVGSRGRQRSYTVNSSFPP